MYFEVLTAAEADFLLTSVFQVLNLNFYISGSWKEKTAAKVLKDKKAALLASKKTSVLNVLTGLDATHVVPDKTFLFIPFLFEAYSLHEVSRRVLLSMWLQVLRGRLS